MVDLLKKVSTRQTEIIKISKVGALVKQILLSRIYNKAEHETSKLSDDVNIHGVNFTLLKFSSIIL